MTFPRFTFGMIVLNGEPFLRYNLRQLYLYAHEIIVVEGAATDAKGIATPDGHSQDNTLQILRDFKANEDPDDKLIIITQDGFWEEKDAMSQAYAECATGDYLWQVDMDEFYKAEDIEAIGKMLMDDPQITAMSFETLTFWGSPNYRCDGWSLRRGASEFHRLFKWGDGYRYVTHRPPTVVDEYGRDMRSRNWVDGQTLKEQGIYLYHYALLLPKQVQGKVEYYRHANWANEQFHDLPRWASESYFSLEQPFRVHNVYAYPSWLNRYQGSHPKQVTAMWADLQTNDSIDLRQTADIEALLESPTYTMKRFMVKWLDYPDRMRLTLNRLRWWLINKSAPLRHRLRDIVRPTTKATYGD